MKLKPMTIKEGYPPNIEQIKEVFDIKVIEESTAIFAWGKYIYNPNDKSIEIADHVLIHESTHRGQQEAMEGAFEVDEMGMVCEAHLHLPFGHNLDNGELCPGPGHAPIKDGTQIWWSRYLTDIDFRFEQELEAYAHQYLYIKVKHLFVINSK